PVGQRAALSALRKLADVAGVAPVDVDASGHVSIEEERFRETDRVVLSAGAGRQGDREAFAAAEEIRRLKGRLSEESLEFRYTGAERDLVAVLFLELQADVDFVRFAGGLFHV